MTRNVYTRRRQSHSLRIQTLEDRRLLAFAAFESTLLRDDNGSPGEIIADNIVAPGETFFLQITAQEFDPGRFGLQAIGVDIAWDASLLDVVEEDFDLSSVVTENLPINQSGNLDQAGGSVRGLGGASNRVLQAGRPIGNAIPETFATIRMQAGDQTGTAELSLQFGEGKIITAPYALLGPRHLELDSEHIRIVARATADSDQPSDLVSETGGPLAADTNTAEEEVEEPAEPIVDAESESTDEQLDSVPQVSEPATTSVVEVVETTKVGDASDEGMLTIDSEPPTSTVSTPKVLIDSEASMDAILNDDSESDDDSVASNENFAAVDQLMSFDVNQDGVFDFADFGLMNVQASLAASVTDLPDAESAEQVLETNVENSTDGASQSILYPKTCLAFPDSNDIAANEAWLDAFAAAWVADTDERLRRRREASNF